MRPIFRSIYYVSYSQIPSTHANCVNVIRMSNALCESTNRVTLIYRDCASDINHINYGELSPKLIMAGHRDYTSLIPSAAQYVTHIAHTTASAGSNDLIYGRHLIGLMATISTSAPIAYEAHRIPVGTMRLTLERLLFSRANFIKLIVISEQLRIWYTDNFPCVRDRIIVAHDGADDPLIGVKHRSPNEKYRHLTIGYCGSLNKGKGADFILQLARALPQHHFVIIGGRPEQVAELKQAANTMQLPNLELRGYVQHGSLGCHYQTFDIALAPYEYLVNGGTGDTNLAPWMSPLKLFEYMAYRIPIIASDLPTIREVISNGTTGLLAPPHNINSWIDSIRLLSDNVELRNTIANKAYCQFKNNYTWHKRASAIIQAMPPR